MKQSFDAYNKKKSSKNTGIGVLLGARVLAQQGHLLTFEGALIREGDAYQNEGAESNTYNVPLTERILSSMKPQVPQFLNFIPYFMEILHKLWGII